MSQDFEERFYRSADGLNLYYRCYPAREPGASMSPIVCLHGLTRNSRDFELLAPLVAQRRMVLVPDLRGRGRSDYDPQPGRYQPPTYLQDIFALLANEGLARVVVIGTSLGGLLAMMMAATRPAAVAGIVLNDVGPEIDQAGLARISEYVGRLTPVTTWDEAAAQSRAIYGSALPDLTDEQWLVYARRGFREGPEGHPVADSDPRIGSAVRASPDAAAPDLWPLWAALAAVPTLAIRGATSDILAAATLDRMAQLKPDLIRVEITNRGHAPLLDEPAAVRAIRDFLYTLS